ncbi:hypothetical protein K0M31_008391 [Melipona bicolor]|uniref:Uncharacterized protein n=1 Tax=Melipona bicolor TaxID=60889 RepID=A0AA40FQW6_9HYME|nr:hypothetical protein K0M31_008391 [Melipona bicolor]
MPRPLQSFEKCGAGTRRPVHYRPGNISHTDATTRLYLGPTMLLAEAPHSRTRHPGNTLETLAFIDSAAYAMENTHCHTLTTTTQPGSQPAHTPVQISPPFIISAPLGTIMLPVNELGIDVRRLAAKQIRPLTVSKLIRCGLRFVFDEARGGKPARDCLSAPKPAGRLERFAGHCLQTESDERTDSRLV